MSKMSREKGRKAESEVVHILRDAGWKDAERTHDGRAQRTRGDIRNGPAGVHFEVKRVERLNVPAALRQAEADASPLDIPVLVHRSSRQDWQATILFTDLLELLKLREA